MAARKTSTRRHDSSRRAAKSRATKSRATAKRRGGTQKWSAEVTKHSDALDLEKDVFKGSPRQIARSLKRSAERRRRRKSSPYRSAMSMLTFYINRGGTNLSSSRRKTLKAAKDELRALFDRE
jgi:hypothetical protein